ncbi:uroporphyrinogen decarboxylase family protein [Geminisphaera colitermitum]|uniref:uroporphyrinogen decarboxylase family protein n=1 Tax=Geminisphaera colitermitum TaxID=1148786 RepID=UPI000196539E|nr:uroporphyrinogen decarboxylase family protein [Geminisphaera colitermitum]
MTRQYYLDLAASGLRMPMGVHLVLHEHADHEAILLDGDRLGAVVAETARRYRTPLAMPLMDLTLEKDALLRACGVPAADIEKHHFNDSVSIPELHSEDIPLTPRMTATCRAITHVAAIPDLVAMGMCIGPFSFMTKLVSDPITPVFLAGTGLTASDEAEIAIVEKTLALAERMIHRYLRAQIEADARAIIICEPAANLVYFSPNQLEENNHAVFDRYVMEPMRRIARLLADAGVDLVFHDCGELTESMIRRFGTLGASIISLGSSRTLWEDAAFIPRDTVLFGNLPTKRFYAPQLTVAEVETYAATLLAKMREAAHPFILGSECDVLSVPGSEHEIHAKVDAFMNISA